MADKEPASLGDFFANKKKKKAFKTVNLNNAGTDKKEAKPEKKKADAKDDEWEEKEEEPNIVVPQIKVAQELLGRLDKPSEEEPGQEQEASEKAPVWRTPAAKAEEGVSSRKFPTLSAANRGKGPSVEEQEEQSNQKRLNKNAYAGLENDDDEEDKPKKKEETKEGLRAPKKQGERESATAAEEAMKSPDVKPAAKPKKEKKEKETKKEEVEEPKKEPKKEATQDHPDLKIKPDEEAIRAKFVDRKKLRRKPLDPKDVGGG